MSSVSSNIHPVFERILGREEKQNFLNQHSRVIWMTGLSGSGKTTLAIGLERRLNELGFLTQILDGDNIRTGINNNLGFSVEDRTENIRRIAEVSKLFIDCGVICINCFVSPTKDIRDKAKEIIGKEDFVEVYINADYELCEKRDVKGLYKKARNGEIKNFTGLDSPFDIPECPDAEIKTGEQSVEESVETLLNKILPHIKK
ncbi:MAG: adenylyl-sulfate kinase [Marinifilaceae bacterium]|jgi:adenylylsulfate kinase|nr:adenylyl-sulfate kinase [Marinifilaceae bacterium]